MSNPSTSPFPSPIGGIPLANDLAPSIVFACLYACLMGLAVYRVSRPISRTISLFAALFFVIERYVHFIRCLSSASDLPWQDTHMVLARVGVADAV